MSGGSSLPRTGVTGPIVLVLKTQAPKTVAVTANAVIIVVAASAVFVVVVVAVVAVAVVVVAVAVVVVIASDSRDVTRTITNNKQQYRQKQPRINSRNESTINKRISSTNNHLCFRPSRVYKDSFWPLRANSKRPRLRKSRLVRIHQRLSLQHIRRLRQLKDIR